MDVPCIIKWIGSKRIQSGEIVQYFPNFINTYYEPFCGGCSVLFQLLSSPNHYVNRCVCSDINGDLIDLWNTVKRDPDGLYDEYVRMWTEMKRSALLRLAMSARSWRGIKTSVLRV